MKRSRLAWSCALPLALLHAFSVEAQSPAKDAPPPTVQMTIAQARQVLAETGRQACMVEYSEANNHADLASIGWETGAFCDCAEKKLFAGLSDDLIRQVAGYLGRSQNKLKTLADVQALAAEPGMTEYVRIAKNAKGNCIYVKTRGR